MKKKLILFAFLCTAAFSLTACSDFLDMFYFGGLGGGDGGYQSISTPPPGDTTPHYAPDNYTYKSYIANNCYNFSATPAIGTAKLLVIPVWFTDSNNYISTDKKASVRGDIEKAYFGTNEDVGWRSVKTYYEEESHGRLSISGIVTSWYECGKNTGYYSVDDETEKTRDLVKEAANWYLSTVSSDVKKTFDCDADGYLDGVMLIYAAPDFQALRNESYSNLWAYCHWIQDKTVKQANNPGANAFFWASYDFMYGSSKVKGRTGTTYNNGDTTYATIDTHTYIHEMGHMFGLLDYYDYTKQYDPAGSFSMQDANIGGHDPFSSYALGWGKAYVPTETTTIDLKPFSTSGELIVLKPNPEAYEYSPFDEYLIIEYYTPTGLNEFDTSHKYMSSENKDYPMGSQVPGIRLWHVDARLLYPKTYANGKYTFVPENITTNPTVFPAYGVTLMMTNTYYKNGIQEGYLSPLGRDYSDYNLLHLIRNSDIVTDKVAYSNRSAFSASTLFTYGDSFNMDTYKKQFVGSTKLNNGETLGFGFEINACKEEYASITITKL